MAFDIVFGIEEVNALAVAFPNLAELRVAFEPSCDRRRHVVVGDVDIEEDYDDDDDEELLLHDDYHDHDHDHDIYLDLHMRMHMKHMHGAAYAASHHQLNWHVHDADIHRDDHNNDIIINSLPLLAVFDEDDYHDDMRDGCGLVGAC